MDWVASTVSTFHVVPVLSFFFGCRRPKRGRGRAAAVAAPVMRIWRHSGKNMAVADTEPSPGTKIPRPFLIPTQIPSCQVS